MRKEHPGQVSLNCLGYRNKGRKLKKTTQGTQIAGILYAEVKYSALREGKTCTNVCGKFSSEAEWSQKRITYSLLVYTMTKVVTQTVRETVK
jgi:hypothetical protein